MWSLGNSKSLNVSDSAKILFILYLAGSYNRLFSFAFYFCETLYDAPYPWIIFPIELKHTDCLGF
jgi:hypothetical protein